MKDLRNAEEPKLLHLLRINILSADTDNVIMQAEVETEEGEIIKRDVVLEIPLLELRYWLPTLRKQVSGNLRKLLKEMDGHALRSNM